MGIVTYSLKNRAWAKVGTSALTESKVVDSIHYWRGVFFHIMVHSHSRWYRIGNSRQPVASTSRKGTLNSNSNNKI